MNWLIRTSQLDLKVIDDCYDAHGGEIFCSIKAHLGDRLVGILYYSIFEDEAHIKNIETAKDMRHQGIATAMINKLKSVMTGNQINWGMMTDEGAALKKTIAHVIEPLPL